MSLVPGASALQQHPLQTIVEIPCAGQYSREIEMRETVARYEFGRKEKRRSRSLDTGSAQMNEEEVQRKLAHEQERLRRLHNVETYETTYADDYGVSRKMLRSQSAADVYAAMLRCAERDRARGAVLGRAATFGGLRRASMLKRGQVVLDQKEFEKQVQKEQELMQDAEKQRREARLRQAISRAEKLEHFPSVIPHNYPIAARCTDEFGQEWAKTKLHRKEQHIGATAARDLDHLRVDSAERHQERDRKTAALKEGETP
ncbi:unnamed protein product, partial [Amoebophrya sp. A25]|eukprot:GSA25T00006356001.1